MKNTFVLLCALLCSFSVYATTYQVGATRTYVSPYALYQANVVVNGDIIEIDAETYSGNACLAVWQASDLLIRGVGGRPHLEAAGQYIWGKGIWVLAGDHITVENIEFSGATVPDKNGAGIRLDGSGLTVRHCFFHDNENGILTNNTYSGDILIEYSEFANNGFGAGYSHNLYIGHVNKLTFQFNYTHHAFIGHCLKSRANENYIYYNRIADEETGASSRLIDLPNGGFSIIMGNLLMQGEDAPNNNMVGYGREGLSNTDSQVFIINNTFVNKRIGSCIFVDIEPGTVVANVSNNIFAGGGTLINGTTTTMDHNLEESSIADLFFTDEMNYNYHLTEASPAINYGVAINAVNGYSLTPDFVYEHPLASAERITVGDTIDVGAYEYINPLETSLVLLESIQVFPNPTTGMLTIYSPEYPVQHTTVLDVLGRILWEAKDVKTIDLSRLHEGVYYLKIETRGGFSAVRRIVKGI